MIEAAERAIRLNVYAPSHGLPALRGAIAAKLVRENGVDTDPDDVLVTNGAMHALFIVLLLDEAQRAVKKGRSEDVVVKSLVAIDAVKRWVRGRFRGRSRPLMPMETSMLQPILDEVEFVFDVALSGPYTSKLWTLRRKTGIARIFNSTPLSVSGNPWGIASSRWASFL